MTDGTLEGTPFPKTKSATNKQIHDDDCIRRELPRNEVSKKLLRVEYCKKYNTNDEELHMYSQLCYYIQKNEEKHKAVIHILRKPGMQIKVDWTSDLEQPIDPDICKITGHGFL